MRTVIIGSKRLSVELMHLLKQLGHDVCCVFTRDAEPGMRVWHEQLGHPSLHREAQLVGIRAYEGMNVNSPEALKLIETLELDAIFSCFWGEIMREPLLNLPRLGVFNFHTALLPKNRGSWPMAWAMIRGESHTGITLHKMMCGVDNGPIVDQLAVEIEAHDTGLSLYEKVGEAAVVLASRCLPKIADGTYTLRLQQESESSFNGRGQPYNGVIHPLWSEAEKDRFIRALTFPPFAGARSH